VRAQEANLHLCQMTEPESNGSAWMAETAWLGVGRETEISEKLHDVRRA